MIAGAVVIAIYHVPILNFIQSLLKETITTVALGAVALALLYVLFNKKTRNLIWYMYKGFMRRLTGLFVQIDPIKILENYVEYLTKHMRQMNTHITQLKGPISQLKTIILKHRRDMEHSLKLPNKQKTSKNDS